MTCMLMHFVDGSDWANFPDEMKNYEKLLRSNLCRSQVKHPIPQFKGSWEEMATGNLFIVIYNHVRSCAYIIYNTLFCLYINLCIHIHIHTRVDMIS